MKILSSVTLAISLFYIFSVSDASSGMPKGRYQRPAVNSICLALIDSGWRAINHTEDATPEQILAMPASELQFNEAGDIPPVNRILDPAIELRAIDGVTALLRVDSQPMTLGPDKRGLFSYNSTNVRDTANQLKKGVVLERLAQLSQRFGTGQLQTLTELPRSHVILTIGEPERIAAFFKILPEEVARRNDAAWDAAVDSNPSHEKSIQRLTGPWKSSDYVLSVAFFMLTNAMVAKLIGEQNLLSPSLLLKSTAAFAGLFGCYALFRNWLINYRIDQRFPPSYKAEARVDLEDGIAQTLGFLKSRPSRGQFMFFEAATLNSADPTYNIKASWFIRITDEEKPVLTLFLVDEGHKK